MNIDDPRVREDDDRYVTVNANPKMIPLAEGVVQSFTVCIKCSAFVWDKEDHDKFHDAYKPARKASFAVAHQDGHVEIQMIDGSKIVANANEDGTPAMDEEAARYVMNSMNKQLAPFYEGGETAIENEDHEQYVMSVEPYASVRSDARD